MSFLWILQPDRSKCSVLMHGNFQICCFRNETPPIFGAKQSKSLRYSEHITPPFATFCIAKSYFLAHRKPTQNVWFVVIVWLTTIYQNLHILAIFLHSAASEILQAILRHIKQQSFLILKVWSSDMRENRLRDVMYATGQSFRLLWTENNVFFCLGIKKYGKDLVNSRKSITFALAFEKYSSAGHIWCP